MWFTETGGIVYRCNRSHITFPESKAHAAIATRWLFQKLIPLSSRITRVYIYNWTGAGCDARFDAGVRDLAGGGDIKDRIDVLGAGKAQPPTAL